MKKALFEELVASVGQASKIHGGEVRASREYVLKVDARDNWAHVVASIAFTSAAALFARLALVQFRIRRETS